MIIDQNTYYLLIGIIVLLSALLVGVSISYYTAEKRLSKLTKKEEEVLEAAEDEAEKIISRANKIRHHSDEALNAAADKITAEEEANLLKKSEEIANIYQQQLTEMNQNSLAAIKEAGERNNAEINKHFEDLKNILSAQTVDSQKQAETKVKEEYDKLEKELQDYRTTQMAKIDSNIYEILLKVSKEVLGRGLDAKEHEQLIIDALAQAEKETH